MGCQGAAQEIEALCTEGVIVKTESDISRQAASVAFDATATLSGKPQGAQLNAHVIHATVGAARQLTIELPVDFQAGTAMEIIILSQAITQ